MADQNINNGEQALDPQNVCTVVPTPGVAGSALNTTTQVVCAICNIHVTPAPEKVLGSLDYYRCEDKHVPEVANMNPYVAGAKTDFKSRHYDFLARHPNAQVCGHHVPPYYTDFGNKYIHSFTENMEPILSEQGKVWLGDARKQLQFCIEEGFKRNKTHDIIQMQADDFRIKFSLEVKTKGLETLELEADNFEKFAYDTHPIAYANAKVYDRLTPGDWIILSNQPGMEQFSSTRAWKQIWELSSGLSKYRPDILKTYPTQIKEGLINSVTSLDGAKRAWNVTSNGVQTIGKSAAGGVVIGAKYVGDQIADGASSAYNTATGWFE